MAKSFYYKDAWTEGHICFKSGKKWMAKAKGLVFFFF